MLRFFLRSWYLSRFVSKWVPILKVRRPVGVVASIVPFNFPAMVPLWCLGDCSD